MSHLQFSVARQDYITEQTRLFVRRIKRSQSALAGSILDDFIKSLEFSGGKVVSSTKNFALVSQLDKLWEEFVRTEGVTLMNDFVKRTQGLFSLNEKYFKSASSVTPETFNKALNTTRELVYQSIGVNTKTGALITNGPLAQIMSDFAPINEVKEGLFKAIANNIFRIDMKDEIQTIVLGTDEKLGSIERQLNRNMKDPFEQFDRVTGTNMSIDLKLNYAFYAGGLVPLSRDFCIVRNGKVFSREEIGKFGTPQDKFGGYTNKSAGEFQGKPKIGYDPFTSLGGFNCLHILNWISDELAFRRRPDLKPPAP